MKNLSLFSFFLSILSCATVDVPPGGDKDTTPPKLLSSYPDSAALNIATNTVSLTFDEYFSLNNLNSNLIISPPLTYPIKSSIKGKNLNIKIKDTLKPNTTYQFFFGNSIADLTENNKTKDLRLVFSTGNQLDTSTLSGFVKDAFTHKPIENCKVLLFLQEKDSQLLTETPYYICLTDKSGRFNFSHISNTDYFLYAIKDANNNNTLDVDEEVGFFEQAVTANTSDHEILLSTFTQNKPLRINEVKQLYNDVFSISINQPLPLNITPVISSYQSQAKDKSVTSRLNDKRDSIYIFLPAEQYDSVQFSITLDTLQQNITQLITKELKPHAVAITADQHEVTPNGHALLSSYYPILKTKSSSFMLFDITDSIEVSIDTITRQGAFELSISAAYKDGHRYLLTLKERAITFANQTYTENDSLYFNTIDPSETGEIEINVDVEDSIPTAKNFILHLVKEGKSDIIRSTKLTSDTVITYNYLKPAKYSIYIFEDIDGNSKWSGAKYLEKLKNEPIWRQKSAIEVRAKWKSKDIFIKTN